MQPTAQATPTLTSASEPKFIDWHPIAPRRPRSLAKRDSVFVSEGVPWPTGNDDPELCRHDVQPFRDVFSDQHLLLAGMLGQFVRLDDHFDLLQMGCEAFARRRWTFTIEMRTILVDR